MSRKRSLLFQILTLGLIGMTIFHAWFGSKESSLEASKKRTELSPYFEDKIVSFQSKLMVGLLRYVEEHQSTLAGSTGEIGLLRSQIKQLVSQSLKLDSAAASETKRSTSDSQLLVKIIVAEYFSLEVELDQLRSKLSNLTPENDDMAQLKQLVLGKGPLNGDELVFAQEQLGWYGSLLGLTKAVEARQQEILENEVFRAAQYTFRKVVVVFFIGFTLFVLGVFWGFYLLVKLSRKTLAFHFVPISGREEYFLEIFCLYLGAMLLGSAYLSHAMSAGSVKDPIVANIALISSLSLLIFWPVLFRIPWTEVRHGLGLRFLGGRQFISNIVVAPLTYFSSWTLLLIIIIPYILILQLLGVDIEQGTHPIVPIILSSTDTMSLVRIIILGVVIAPLIEELMFRGAFYSWLRKYQGKWAAMFTSAFVFAAVHPQGIVGVVPLMVIGLVLAFLREWRNSLVAPILAHACVNGGTFTLLLLFFR